MNCKGICYFQMLLYYHRRLLFNLSRQILSISNQFQSIHHIQPSNNFLIRHMNSDSPLKRKILLKINTIFNENEDINDDSASTSITCLNNELILSESMVKFPFHYRCLVEQQLAICPDRWVPGDQWNELYNVIGEQTKPIFASITMLVCVQLKHIERGRSLFQFAQQYYPNLLTSTSTAFATYMNLLALDFFTLNKNQHDQKYSLYEKELCDVYQNHVKDKQQVKINVFLFFLLKAFLK